MSAEWTGTSVCIHLNVFTCQHYIIHPDLHLLLLLQTFSQDALFLHICFSRVAAVGLGMSLKGGLPRVHKATPPPAHLIKPGVVLER